MDDLADEPIIDAASDRSYWIVDPRQGRAIASATVAATTRRDARPGGPIPDLHPSVIYLAARPDDRRRPVDEVLDRMRLAQT